MTRKRVLVTGASGYVAGQMLPTFRERYDLTLVDARAEDRNGEALADVALADLVDDSVRVKGNARIGAWLLLSGRGLPESMFQDALTNLAPGMGDKEEVEGRYAMLILATSLFGDAIFGERIRQVLGMPDDEEERRRFRHWMAEKLIDGESLHSAD